MVVKLVFAPVAFVLLTFGSVLLSSLTAAEPKTPETQEYLKFFKIGHKFIKNLTRLITNENPDDSMVYSPISVQNMLGLAYAASSGATLSEIGKALDVLPTNKSVRFKQNNRLVKSRRTENLELQVANKLYINRHLRSKKGFRQDAEHYFGAEVERVGFSDTKRVAKNINQWVANKTNTTIRNLVDGPSLDQNTLAMIVNAIYFKAKWTKGFPTENTHCREFEIEEDCEKIPVEMMYQMGYFNYTDMSKELGARVLQMPYADSNLSMLVVLPTEIDGLAEDETRLHSIDLRYLPERMHDRDAIEVYLPKFSIQFELEMIEMLKKLQITLLFEDSADLSRLFGSPQKAKISQMKHKAVIEVNEAGAKDASVTNVNVSLGTSVISFKADHPFLFAIISPEIAYFVGHVINPTPSCNIA